MKKVKKVIISKYNYKVMQNMIKQYGEKKANKFIMQQQINKI